MAETYADRAHKEILIESWSNSARELLIRGHATEGPFAETHTTNADRSRAINTYQIHGIPQSITVSPLTGPVRRGECYVRVTLMMDGEPVERLVSAYLTDGKTLSWPPGVHEGFTEGPGLIRLVAGTNPIAGAEVSEAVPTNALWRFIGLRVVLVTDATVTNRYVNLNFSDGVTNFFRLQAAALQAASDTKEYELFLHLADIRLDGDYYQYMWAPSSFLFEGWTITSNTSNLQAGDNFAAPVLIVEEWIQE